MQNSDSEDQPPILQPMGNNPTSDTKPEIYLAHMMGQLGEIIRQNQNIQIEFQLEQRRQQAFFQEQLIHLATQRVDVHTSPDFYSLIPPFEGTPSENAKDWLLHLKRVGVQQKWSEQTTLAAAVGKLTGNARAWQQECGTENAEWHEWENAFLARFCKSQTLREWTDTIQKRLQTNTENLIDYIHAKKKIIKDCPIQLTPTDKVDFLISGIKDEFTTRMLRLQKFSNEDELVEAVHRLDICGGSNPVLYNTDPNKHQSDSNTTEQGMRMASNQRPILPSESYTYSTRPVGKQHFSDPRQQGLNRDRRNITCYNCGRRGHLSFECDRQTNNLDKRIQNRTVYKQVNCILHSSETTLPVVDGRLEDGRFVRILLDSGSELSLINRKCLNQGAIIQEWEKQTVLSILGSTYKPTGAIWQSITIGDFTDRILLCVVDNIPYDLLLGANWRREANITITFFPNGQVELSKQDTQDPKNTGTTTCHSHELVGLIMKVPSEHPDPECPHIPPSLVQEIEETIKRCDTTIPDDAKVHLREILTEYADVFVSTERNLGLCPKVEHSIHLTTEAPVRNSPYRYSKTDRDFINLTVQEWIEKGIAEETFSEYASPVVIVNQPHHTTTPKRLCVDYRKLNKITTKINFPIPVIEDVIEDVLADDAEFFNILDIKTAFMTIKVRKSDRHKTAFITQDGTYQFKRMPFGLCNAPFTMQKTMNEAYRGLKGTRTYMDDIGQGGKTIHDLLDELEAALQRTREYGLTMDLKKCQIAQRQVRFLGYVIQKNGRIPDPCRVSTIDRFENFSSQKQIRSFLQFASHYRRFIENFATIAKPLNTLLRKDSTFQWTEECQQAVDTLKQKLKTPPILGRFRPECPTNIHVDASQNGLGALLTQTQDGRKVVIEYASRAVSDADSKLHSNDLECMAVHWAICEKFKIYLYGLQDFQVWTDNWSATYLMEKGGTNRRLARWALDLQDYNFTIRHVPGSKNDEADVLSRMPTNQLCAAIILARDSRLIQEQKSDVVCRKIIETLSGEKNKRNKNTFEQFKIRDGVLVKTTMKNKQTREPIYLPSSLRNTAMEMCHDKDGHMDADRTLSKLRIRYWWPGMSNDIKDYVSTCSTCLAMNRKTSTQEGLLSTWNIPDEPYEMISLDFFGPIKNDEEFTHVLISVDHATRHVVAEPVTSTSSATVVNFLRENIFQTYGVPATILTDGGSGFTSKETRDYLNRQGIKQIFSPPYWPESNGLVERAVASIKSILRKSTNEQEGWPLHVKSAAMSLNTSINGSSKKTPFYLLHGSYNPRTAGDNRLGTLKSVTPRETQLEQLHTTRILAKEDLMLSSHKAKTRYDKKRRAHDFEKNDLVLYSQGERPDVLSPLFEGPYTIEDKLGKNIFRIRGNDEGSRPADVRNAHVRQLKKWKQRKPPDNLDDSHSDQEHSHSDEEDNHSDQGDNHSDQEDRHSDQEDSHPDQEIPISEDQNDNSEEMRARPTRKHKAPIWMKDYQIEPL